MPERHRHTRRRRKRSDGSSSSIDQTPPLSVAQGLRYALEGLILWMVVWTPWAFGVVDSTFELILAGHVAALLALSATLLMVERRLPSVPCPVLLPLAGLLVFTAFQLLPLPTGVRDLLAPGVGSLWHELLPAQAETLPDGTSIGLPGAVLSIHPTGTRRLLVQLLAVFLIYVVVRHQVAGPGTLRRLAWVGLANGAALTFLAIAQMGYSERDEIYWQFRTGGTVFGPFICRNHFAFYANVCIGLGAGLLGETVGKQTVLPPEPSGAQKPLQRLRDWTIDSLQVLQEPRKVGILLVLAFILAGVALSTSRGGALALGGAALVTLVVGGRTAKGKIARWLPMAALASALAVAVIAWQGWDRVSQRLGTLDDPVAALETARASGWVHSLPWIPKTFLTGTGGGTFRFLEPLADETPRPAQHRALWDHAHNEYLEALVEGGLIRLVLTVWLVVIPIQRAWRAARANVGRATGGLLLGGLFGLTAVALHSVAEFGIHLPAIALLAAVLAANVMATGVPDESAAAPAERPVAAVALAVGAVALGLFLLLDAWRADQAERHRLAGASAGRVGEVKLAEAHYAAAAAWRPADAELRLLLADARLRIDSPAGLRDLLEARNGGPLQPRVQVLLASHCKRLHSAEPASRYLDRVLKLLPNEPEVWIACGRQHLVDGQADDAWRAFRRALELGPKHLPEVLDLTGSRLSHDALREKVLPADPWLLLAAGDHLYPADPEGRKPFAAAALKLLEGSEVTKPDLLRRRGRAERLLGRTEDSLRSLRAAADRGRERRDIILEYIEALRRAGRYEDALRELRSRLRVADDMAVANLRAVIEREVELDKDK